MEKRLELYGNILKLVGQTMRMNDLRNVVTFAWMVVGLLLSKTIHLGQWGLQRDSGALAASKERQISRWLHNPKIKPAEVYRDFATAAVLPWAEQKAVLALDSSMLWGRYVIIRVSLIYRGRALPLAWKVLEHGSASVSFAEYEPILKEVNRLLPLHCQVVLLADRGFADVDLMQLAVRLGWNFNIRAKGNLLVHRAFKPTSCKMSLLMPPKGEVRLIHTVQITQRRFGPVHLVLAHVRTQKGYEQWILISDRPTSRDTLDEYALRFDIEENFLDDKSAGFQLEASELRDANALSRLCLVLAVATLYLVSTGTAIVTLQRRHLVDTHWNRGLSYFQIGWRYLLMAVAFGNRLLTHLWLDPEPDPEPVYASKQQARTSTVAFSSIYFYD
jgi:hypothetical protein